MTTIKSLRFLLFCQNFCYFADFKQYLYLHEMTKTVPQLIKLEDIEAKGQQLLHQKFAFINAVDIARQGRKYYPQGRERDRKGGLNWACTYLYLIENHLDNSEADYSYQDKATQIGLKWPANITFYRKRHAKRWATNHIYRLRIYSILISLARLDQERHRTFYNKLP